MERDAFTVWVGATGSRVTLVVGVGARGPVPVAVGVGVSVGDGDAVADGSRVGVNVGQGVRVGVGKQVNVALGAAVGSGASVGVGVREGVGVIRDGKVGESAAGGVDTEISVGAFCGVVSCRTLCTDSVGSGVGNGKQPATAHSTISSSA
jgi:hypothetical protein